MWRGWGQPASKGRKVYNLCYTAVKYVIEGSPVVSFDSDHVPAETEALEESSTF